MATVTVKSLRAKRRLNYTTTWPPEAAEAAKIIKAKADRHKAQAGLQEQPFDAVVEAVRNDLLLRSRLGQLKYGVGIDRTNADLRAWLQHAYEEALDMANYLKRSILELDRTPHGNDTKD